MFQHNYASSPKPPFDLNLSATPAAAGRPAGWVGGAIVRGFVCLLLSVTGLAWH